MSNRLRQVLLYLTVRNTNAQGTLRQLPMHEAPFVYEAAYFVYVFNFTTLYGPLCKILFDQQAYLFSIVAYVISCQLNGQTDLRHCA